ncbi:MAG TPA: His-Xaa-Ser repeat protein HxsA2 [Terriglobales bacterium]|nr:His-Xaa-Ser repeat protein HxsA2 [Terriglobales bacterium]
MKKTTVVVLPLATALASLSGAANTSSASNSVGPTPASADAQGANKVQPNTIFTAGEDLFGLLVTTNADGTIVAQHSSHYSHSSHASHASHASHFSSRY